MSVTAVVRSNDGGLLRFEATVVHKDGHQTVGISYGVDFYRGTAAALKAGEGLPLDTGERVAWTIPAIH